MRRLEEGPRFAPRGDGHLVGMLPGLVTLVGVVATLLAVDTPVAALVRYLGYLVLGVVLPGMLVHRALRGRPVTVVEDVALGAATGVALGLVGWAGFMVLHLQRFLWVWPPTLLLVFAAVPSLRRHWSLGRYPQRVGRAGWLMGLALLGYSVTLAVTGLRHEPLPPAPSLYYVDVYWHLANASELTRSLPPRVPSVADRVLDYHYFVNAHLGASHLVSGVDLPVLYLRLWQIPVVAVIVGLLFGVARKSTGRTWAAGLATVILVAPTQLMPWAWYRPWSSFALTEGSPSQVFGVLFLLLAAHILVDLIREGRLSTGAWALLVLAAIGGPGSKPSVVPVLLGGLGCVLLLALWRRERVLALLTAIGLLVAVVVLMAPLVDQSKVGSGIKLFGILYFVRIWTGYVNDKVYPGTGPHVIPGLDEPGALRLAALIVATMVLQHAWVVAAAPLLRHRRRTDPVALFLAGGFAAAALLTAVVDHPGASQIYFARTGVSFAVILVTWGLAVAVEGARRHVPAVRVAGMCLVAALAGALLAWRVVRAGDGRRPGRERIPDELQEPFAVLVIGLLLALTVWWVVRMSSSTSLRGVGPAAFSVFVLALFLVQGPHDTGRLLVAALGDEPPRPLAAHAVNTDEHLAARWMAEHVPADDVAATNVHCLTKRTVDRCEARSYWVPALTEHRYLYESWAYTEENLARVGEFSGGFAAYPPDDPARLAFNDSVFTSPTAASVTRMRDRHGVRWLFADLLAGPVSSELDSLATLRFSNDSVRIYELDRN